MKQKRVPFVVLSRESLDAAVASVAQLKIEYAAEKAQMELEIAAVQEKHQKRQLELAQQIEMKEAGVFVYCQQNREELFPDKKSIDFLLATVGFRTDPPSVEKMCKKDTWTAIAARLEGLEWGAPFVREPEPEVNKKALLDARGTLTPDQLKMAGIRFEQDEQFFIEPKSEVADKTSLLVA